MNHINNIIDSDSEPTSQKNKKDFAVNRGGCLEQMDSSASSNINFDEKSSQPSSNSARAVTTTNTATSSNESSSMKDDSLQIMAMATSRRNPNSNHNRNRYFVHHKINHESSGNNSSLSTNPDQDKEELKQDGTLHETYTFPKWTHNSKSRRHLDITASVLKSSFGSSKRKRSSFVTLTSSSQGNSSDLTPMEEDVAEPNSETNSASEHGSDGYSASASSNDVFCMGQSSCSSPSMSSSEDPPNNHSLHLDPTTMGDVKRRSESSSDVADFSSTQSARRSSSPSSSCSSHEFTGFDLEDNSEEGDEDHTYLPINTASVATSPHVPSSKGDRKRSHSPRDTVIGAPKDGVSLTNARSPSLGIVSYSLDQPMTKRNIYYAHSNRQFQSDIIRKRAQKSMGNKVTKPTTYSSKPFTQADLKMNESFMYIVGVDIMGVILSFLKPAESHNFLTMPISKTFRALYTQPQELWKVLCLSEPFLVKIKERDAANSSEDDSLGSYPICSQLGVRHNLGKYRLLYASFIRCLRYLDRIKEDAVNGRLPTSAEEVIESSEESIGYPAANSTSLMEFFAQARDLIQEDRHDSTLSDINSQSVDRHLKSSGVGQSLEVSDDKQILVNGPKPKVKYSYSTLTDRLLGPSKNSTVAGPVELPWSCAIYSIMNWLVAFADVEGIQIMCLKVLPYLLEDENQRTIAQRAGLTDIVLKSMILFPSSVALHTASFHTLVLLARPLGGREGMLFHVAMLNTSGILCSKSGIAVMLDSMKRFADYEVLQAMACWSLVNIALIPAQKKVLVSLGGIAAAANAMMKHPLSPDVQFRALFSLINLVIPSNSLPENARVDSPIIEAGEQSEKELLDESVLRISNLVVLAMRNFCSSEAILNRACLVLHNLSLNEEYHRTLLFTPHCYQMLEWCIANYRNDSVLQQSAGGTLQRLQLSLASDDTLRSHFAETLRSQEFPQRDNYGANM